MRQFKLVADFKPSGDQPSAIEALVQGLHKNNRYQTLLGVTGSGKTFTMANIIEEVQRPTLVIAHNKTLAAQLAMEFRDFFPENAVEYFVSYYDYYQPEAYVPKTDVYIEKDASINEDIDRLRHAATQSLFTRRDVIIVASVSCIYGLGAPEDYYGFVLDLTKGESRRLDLVLKQLVNMQYQRNSYELVRGNFRVRGDFLEIVPAYEEMAYRVEFFGDVVERIVCLDPVSGEVLRELDHMEVYPAKHWVTPQDKLNQAIVDIERELEEQLEVLGDDGKLLESQRLAQKTRYDLEMLRETGFCSGIENYSCHLGGRHDVGNRKTPSSCGSTPWTLLNYFPEDLLVFIDESHMTIPQLNGMYHGDLSRKTTLVEFGFRLPSALDNRPLSFEEFQRNINQAIFVSATPGPYEIKVAQQSIEQVIRPTGLLDPTIEVKPTDGQIDDLLHQIKLRVESGDRCLVTTLTKRMAEELSDYFLEIGIRVHYLHSEQDTFQRSEILRDLRLGVYDVVVGINLLREGLDLPEVSLIAILDADKEGYLRSASSLIQTVGRAARHENGHIIMYADNVTKSMKRAIGETKRRRDIQSEHNAINNIIPQGIKKEIRDITERVKASAIDGEVRDIESRPVNKDEISLVIEDLGKKMKIAAGALEFEKAAMYRDEILELRQLLESGQ